MGGRKPRILNTVVPGAAEKVRVRRRHTGVLSSVSRVRRWLLILAAVAALPFLPLPRACDPRVEELPSTRYADLLRFSGQRSRAEVESALALIDPHRALAPYLRISDDALDVREPPVRILLRPAAAPAQRRALRRIGLDPGHWGGEWSRTEQRYITRQDGPGIREGDLTWATARLVERGLAAEGTEVVLLRGPPPGFPYAADADPRFDPGREVGLWLAENRPRPGWLNAWSTWGLWSEGRAFAGSRPFDLYNRHDLRMRAARASEEAVDLTLSLHYNVTFQEQNGVLAFLPGNFLPDELVTASQRYWALRRVLDGTLEDERRLAAALGASLMRSLALPALTEVNSDGPLAPWLPVDPAGGVYARNLAILRRAPGLALLLEGPCVNEREEYGRMQDTSVVVDGRRYPARVAQYADGVVSALRAWR
jgi:N-acetylmuramoyl-L-alanine amidase